MALLERLERRLDKSGECWNWTGYRNRHGYGQVSFMGKLFLAHRAMWSATHGEIPAGLSVLHRCDNPPCCNPAHLFLGTRADNVADMIAKGRDRRGRFPGEKCNFAKLKESDVVEIRKRLAPQKTLAAHYGVNVTTIQRIQYKQNWSHV